MIRRKEGVKKKKTEIEEWRIDEKRTKVEVENWIWGERKREESRRRGIGDENVLTGKQ